MGALFFFFLFLNYTYHTSEQDFQICGKMDPWEF